MNIAEYIREHKLIAIVRGIPKEQLLPTAQAIYRGGITCLEITFDQTATDGGKATTEGIAMLCSEMAGRLEVGAGTVLTVEQAQAAAAAGAKYIISPNVNEEVIRETKKMGLASLPGALTPSEIADAYRFGADFVKVFPVANLGASYIKAVHAPLSHIPLLAVGGVSPENLAEFMAAGAVGAGIGSNLANKKLITEGRFDEIEAIAREYTEALKKL